MKKLLILIILPIIVLSSCSEKEELSRNLKPADELKIAGIYDNPKYNEILESKPPIIIIIIRIHTNYPQCTQGVGICDIVFLGMEIWTNEKTDTGEGDREVYAPIITEDNKEWIYLYYDEDISEYSDSDLIFTVAQELDFTNEEGSKVTIPAGVYEVDRNLGDFGGYKIPAELN